MFKGVYSPVITIMDDNGKLDAVAMQQHINHLAESGLNGLLFLGSLGEFYGFSVEEKKEIIDLAVKTVNKRCQVIVGIGGTSLDEVKELTAYCEKAGVDALNIVSPYYFGPTETAAEAYFGAIADATTLPIMLYNFPDRVGSDLTPKLVATLASKHKNIVAIKDTVDNISHTRRLVKAVKAVNPEFSVLSGFDEYYVVNRFSGGDGTLTGLTNVAPELFVALHKAYEAKEFETMESCASNISKLMSLYEVTDLFIVAIKAAVKMRGLAMSTYTKAPGLPISKDEEARVAAILKEVNLI
ncbi:dihydrodipicolinate synthase family protein [uncultured Veillonella sp.]|uniref:dihydrodipicolinate synthase family protein n=1 Tax=uncultured Veillonella sp. TaxID=159268 RepID=UPI0026250528|nr:dihydrodipicolinate synthase family protein [uncultured Veillonella sp.]